VHAFSATAHVAQGPMAVRAGGARREECFVADKKHRRRGVSSAALAAPLESIRRKGGDVVEAYSMIPRQELCRARARRCGHAPAFGNASTHGTLSMFERQGFEVVARMG
jgi:GNAT superfamily N-acetyltransferase